MVQQVLGVIEKLKKERVAVLLVEQNPLVALSVADRVYVMDKGKVVHEGPAGRLLDDAALRQKLLGI
jgi:branched-chain amino acid transport system ATP-binding protein